MRCGGRCLRQTELSRQQKRYAAYRPKCRNRKSATKTGGRQSLKTLQTALLHCCIVAHCSEYEWRSVHSRKKNTYIQSVGLC
jgi:hypothetical protein